MSDDLTGNKKKAPREPPGQARLLVRGWHARGRQRTVSPAPAFARSPDHHLLLRLLGRAAYQRSRLGPINKPISKAQQAHSPGTRFALQARVRQSQRRFLSRGRKNVRWARTLPSSRKGSSPRLIVLLVLLVSPFSLCRDASTGFYHCACHSACPSAMYAPDRTYEQSDQIGSGAMSN